MSRVTSKKRKLQIKTAHKRKRKLAKLRQEYLAAKTKDKKEKIFTKVSKIAPQLSEEEFLAQAKAKPATKKQKK